MRQIIPGRTGNAGLAAGTAYYALHLQSTQNATFDVAKIRCEAAGTLRNLRCVLDIAPGSGSWTITVMKNGAVTGLAVTISSGTEGENVSDEVDIAEGDYIAYRIARGGLATLAGMSSSIEFTSVNFGECLYGSETGSALQNGEYFSLFNGDGFDNPNSTVVRHVIPCPGTLTSWTVELTARGSATTPGPPGPGNTITFTIWKGHGGGAAVAQDGTGGTPDTRISLSGAQFQGTNMPSLSLIKGDYVYIQYVFGGSPVGSDAKISSRFTGADDQRFPVFGVQNAWVNDDTYCYPNMCHGTAPTDETKSKVTGPITTTTIGGWIVLLSAAPVQGSREFNVRLNGVDSGLSLTFTGSDVLGDIDTPFTLEAADYWSFYQSVPPASPNSANVSFSVYGIASEGSPAPSPVSPVSPASPIEAPSGVIGPLVWLEWPRRSSG